MESFSVELGVRSGDTEVALGEMSTATVMIVDNDGMNNSDNFQLHTMNLRYFLSVQAFPLVSLKLVIVKVKALEVYQ